MPALERRSRPSSSPGSTDLFAEAPAGKSLHTGTDLQRVTFRFSVNTEVHYVVAVPEPGDLVAHRHELWVVMQLGEDSGGAVAICKQSPDQPSGRSLRGPGGAD